MHIPSAFPRLHPYGCDVKRRGRPPRRRKQIQRIMFNNRKYAINVCVWFYISMCICNKWMSIYIYIHTYILAKRWKHTIYEPTTHDISILWAKSLSQVRPWDPRWSKLRRDHKDRRCRTCPKVLGGLPKRQIKLRFTEARHFLYQPSHLDEWSSTNKNSRAMLATTSSRCGE